MVLLLIEILVGQVNNSFHQVQVMKERNELPISSFSLPVIILFDLLLHNSELTAFYSFSFIFSIWFIALETAMTCAITSVLKDTDRYEIGEIRD